MSAFTVDLVQNLTVKMQRRLIVVWCAGPLVSSIFKESLKHPDVSKFGEGGFCDIHRKALFY